MRDTGIAFEAVTGLSFDAAVAACRAELAREGFGVLTEIDVRAKLQEKLGVDVPANLILGACHPPSAHRALQAVPEVSVLLPCNVAVAVEERGTVVRAMNPEGAMGLLGSPELVQVAREVGAALRRVVERVEATPET
ncbi:MAG: DUF302 domain-containing protein [Thermoanaerobaculia bacterium]|nr:MAG: DUF302 domain-containing protein [Thermoanaerobaculia bacterium]